MGYSGLGLIMVSIFYEFCSCIISVIHSHGTRTINTKCANGGEVPSAEGIPSSSNSDVKPCRMSAQIDI